MAVSVSGRFRFSVSVTGAAARGDIATMVYSPRQLCSTCSGASIDATVPSRTIAMMEIRLAMKERSEIPPWRSRRIGRTDHRAAVVSSATTVQLVRPAVSVSVIVLLCVTRATVRQPAGFERAVDIFVDESRNRAKVSFVRRDAVGGETPDGTTADATDDDCFDAASGKKIDWSAASVSVFFGIVEGFHRARLDIDEGEERGGAEMRQQFAVESVIDSDGNANHSSTSRCGMVGARCFGI